MDLATGQFGELGDYTPGGIRNLRACTVCDYAKRLTGPDCFPSAGLLLRWSKYAT